MKGLRERTPMPFTAASWDDQTAYQSMMGHTLDAEHLQGEKQL